MTPGQVERLPVVVVGRWNRHSSEHPQTKELWRARNAFDSGKGTSVSVERAADQLSALLLTTLDKMGVDFVGDGGFRWDSLYDVTNAIRGCWGFDQLTRIPGTNQFHRQPEVTLPLSRDYPLLGDDLKLAKSRIAKPLVVTLPGPYSTARQTKDAAEIGLVSLSGAYADIFNQEVVQLLADGAAIVRIEEPQILDHPEDMEIFREAMERLTKGADLTRLALATWFGGVTDPDFFKLPFGMFALDFVNGRETLPDFPDDKKLIAGIVDAQHPYKETDEEMTGLLDTITKYVPAERVLLAPNTDLHFLPWNIAVEKVHRLVDFAALYRPGRSRETKYEVAPVRVITSVTNLSETSGKVDFSRVTIPRIPFPTSAVGSFPQTPELRAVRAAFKKGSIPEEEYLTVVRRHTKHWMSVQNNLDITVPVSGEFLRDDMAAYFGRAWGGKEGDFVPSYENRRYHPIIYADRLKYGQPLTVEDYQYLQSLSKDRPVKHTLTGPATMADWALLKDPAYYYDQNGFRREMAQAVRVEIQGLIDAGAAIIQVDEPALTTKMRKFSGDVQAIYDAIDGFENDAYLVLHLCYSDMKALDQALPDILHLPFHQIHMEMTNRGYGLLKLIERHRFGDKDIGLGVLDVHSNRIETVEEVVEGVGRARQLFTPEQIWLTPDCGLKDRSEEFARVKLEVMSQAAKMCRAVLV